MICLLDDVVMINSPFSPQKKILLAWAICITLDSTDKLMKIDSTASWFQSQVTVQSSDTVIVWTIQLALSMYYFAQRRSIWIQAEQIFPGREKTY